MNNIEKMRHFDKTELLSGEGLKHGTFENYQIVHGRFNLVPLSNRGAKDVVHLEQDDESNGKDRYIVTPVGERTDKITKKLEAAGVQQLPQLVKEGSHAIYRVPLQAKPLANERLFPDRESTDTYISDKEQFAAFGEMWRKVYDAAHYLPESNFIAGTGMVEFSRKSEDRLFPIPPYDTWRNYQNLESAQTAFHTNVETELKDLYPYTPVQDLLNAASDGFNGENRGA